MKEEFKQLLNELLSTVGNILIEDEQPQPIFDGNIIKGLFSINTPLNSTVRTNTCRLTTEEQGKENKPKKSENSIIYFTEKELKQMSKDFKKCFILKGLVVNCRKRTDKNCMSYEIRYRSNGHNLSVSGRTIEIAKTRFLQKLKEPVSNKPKYPKTINEFIIYFYENYKSKTVCQREFSKYVAYFNNDIKPFFKNAKLKNITHIDCQNLIDKIANQGKNRKAEDVKSILSQVFNYARKLGEVTLNPVELVIFKKAERQHGKALTKTEEKKLLKETAGTIYQVQFAVALYCGLRPNEYRTATIKNGFIIAKNSKRKSGKTEYKKIPINPMLKPYLNKNTKISFCTYNNITANFKKVLPNHILYDLRTTFFNRCIECGVIDSVRDKWMGHHSNEIKQAYTDISDELHFKESEKLSYFLP